MADLLSSIALSSSSIATLFVALALGVTGVVLYFSFNSKYPVVKFLVFDRGRISVVSRRLLGNMAVDPSLIKIVMDVHHKLIGEDITKFTSVIMNGKKYYIARITDAGILIPIDLSASIMKEESGNVKETLRWKLADRWILTGKKQAMEFVNAYSTAKQTTETANPFIVGLLANLPSILVAAIILTTTVIILNFLAGTFQPMVNTLDVVSQRMMVLSNHTVNSTVATQHVISIS